MTLALNHTFGVWGIARSDVSSEKVGFIPCPLEIGPNLGLNIADHRDS